MGSPFPGSMAMPDIPEHAIMTVDSQGRGPADPRETADIVCWCGQPKCRKFLASWKDAYAAYRVALEALNTQAHEALAPELREAWDMGLLQEGARIKVVRCSKEDSHGMHLWHGYNMLCRGVGDEPGAQTPGAPV